MPEQATHTEEAPPKKSWRKGQHDTPCRSIRIPDEVWLPAKQGAEAAGSTGSALVNQLLEEHLRKEARKARKAQDLASA